MSKVSVQNDMWPSFQPIDQPQNAQTRKRASASFNDSGNEHPLSNKRSKNKIGCLDWRYFDARRGELFSFCRLSIFYGLNDSRNFTEKVIINQNQSIDHVYVMGVIRTLEKCEDDASTLSIHTGSTVLLSALNHDKPDEESICQQVKEKIAKRKGITSIRSATNNEDEFQAAHRLASEKLLQVDVMEIDVAEKNLVDSLDIAESKEDVSTATTSTSAGEIDLDSDDTVVKKEKVTAISADQDAEQKQPSSWGANLNLRNFLDILKAPFTRNK